MINKVLNRILPSFRPQHDPAICIASDGSNCAFQPIMIGDLKLTPLIRRDFYRYRKAPILVEAPRHDKKLAIIVPYRNREQHLKIFPKAMKEFLNKQHIENEIYIIEQADGKSFNRAKLINIGATLAGKNADYFSFHDIDMLPEVADYGHTNHPALLANSVSQFDDRESGVDVHHETYFSGSILFRKEDFYKINGYSNEYWHWGFEDADLLLRCLFSGLIPIAYKNGRFRSLPHEKSIYQTADGNYHRDEETIKKLNRLYLKNKERYKKMRRGLIDFRQDGLSSLSYQKIDEEKFELYKKVRVTL